eukprot:8971274-Alexandrium_andersonii.AAC.1
MLAHGGLLRTEAQEQAWLHHAHMLYGDRETADLRGLSFFPVVVDSLPSCLPRSGSVDRGREQSS